MACNTLHKVLLERYNANKKSHKSGVNHVSLYVAEQGWNLVDIYVDDGYSGTSFDRPAVTRLLEDAKAGKINLIIVKALSPFGRYYIQVRQYIDYIFPAYNIRFIALKEGLEQNKTQRRFQGKKKSPQKALLSQM